MHSKIFQITKEKLSKEEYITENTFYDHLPEGADYVQNLSKEEAEACLSWVDEMLKGIFTRKGRELTFIGVETFIGEWVEKIKESANALTVENMKDSLTLFRHKMLCERTHKDVWFLVYQGADGEEYADFFADFIWYLHATEVKKGTKFYIGGIVDYHF